MKTISLIGTTHFLLSSPNSYVFETFTFALRSNYIPRGDYLTVKKLYGIQVLSYSAIMLSITFVPQIAKNLGANWLEIALVVGAYNISYFSSSLIFGRLADLHGRRRFIVVGLGLATIAFFLQFFYFNYTSLLIFRIIAGFTVGIYPAAVISIAHDFGMKMGKLSSWGAMGWTLGSYVAGAVGMLFALRYTFLLSSFLFLGAFIISLTVPDSGVRVKSVPLFPVNVFKRNWVLYTSYFLRHVSGTMIWTFWVLFVRSIGGNAFWQAATMGINSMVQFFVMYFYTDLGTPKKLIIAGLGLSSMTFLSYAFINNVYLLIPSQVTLALSWSFLYVGALKHLTETNPEKSTATGFLNSTISIAAASGPFLGGAVMYLTNSYVYLMISAFIISMLGVVLFALRGK
ncbi:MAG: MFS transporter [Euryarchaeota archaeon]|nr:MFS transporter [Euryarchaeota archaeon]